MKGLPEGFKRKGKRALGAVMANVRMAAMMDLPSLGAAAEAAAAGHQGEEDMRQNVQLVVAIRAALTQGVLHTPLRTPWTLSKPTKTH